MRLSQQTTFALLASTSLVSATIAVPAFAQQGAQNQVTIEEIIVTATRREELLNRVPISITAMTNETIESRGLTDPLELQRYVPSLRMTGGTTDGIGNFSIRGIVASAGTPTTGVYLDDVPVQKRQSLAANQSNGSPVPPLFDVERVEILRGPQGTLFGGSSMGGTIRFITTPASLTEFSARARIDVSKTQYGGISKEAGAAVGAPIIDDRLGFRVSIWGRRNGGYIDMRDPYAAGAPIRIIPPILQQGFKELKDANTDSRYALRGALKYAASDDLEVNLSLYSSRVTDSGWPDASSVRHTDAFTTPQRCFRTAALTTSLNGVACTSTGIVYTRPAQTYGPYDLGKFENISTWLNSPFTTDLDIDSLTLDYSGSDIADIKSVTSYYVDFTRGTSQDTSQISNQQAGITLYRPYPNYNPLFRGDNRRHGFIQELKLTSADPNAKLTWVAGAYYSEVTNDTKASHGLGWSNTREEADVISLLMFGFDTAERYRIANSATTANAPRVEVMTDGSLQKRYQNLYDKEYAFYGEANYTLLDKFRMTAGARWSKITFKYDAIAWGALPGFADPYFIRPNGTPNQEAHVSGTSVQKPVTPKVGLQYLLSDDDMLYATASRGFRAGGVNARLSSGNCSPALAAIGITADDIPVPYGPDTVWSYEGGAKLRMLENRLAVQGSLYNIEWSDVQLNNTIPGCGVSFVTNAGHARSRGFDVQAQAVFDPITFDVTMGYNKGEYTETAYRPTAPGQPPAPVVNKGDRLLGLPAWAASGGVQFDFDMIDRPAFIRADYTWAGSYKRTVGPGATGFTPDTYDGQPVSRMDVRAGVTVDQWSWDLYVNNVLNSDDVLSAGGGRTGCPVAEGALCATPTNNNPLKTENFYRPREIGLRAQFRY